jgi:alpha-glucosidase
MTLWWQRGIIYQIYPRSFQDSNGDGVGDLPGIVQRLDYLRWLGVDAIWLSPMYPSPMADFGYDVSDYVDVNPLFGTLADMDRLIEEAHARGLKVIVDYVGNHSSDQHAWFLESRSSRDNPRRDWYIWRDPAPDGGPPTNWLSRFGGGPAWTFDETTGQYYLHSFLPEQPDLNWRNSGLRAAMLDVLRFWMERGVDGFRVDVAHRFMKDAQFRDNPPRPAWKEGMPPYSRLLEVYTQNTPDNFEANRWLRAAVDEYPERVLVGELFMPLRDLVKYYGEGDQYHLPFNFHLIFSPWRADVVRALANEYERLLPAGAWPNWVLGNHDQHRIATRVGAGQARMAMMLLLTLRGTPTLYYGDEIGMPDGEIPPDRVVDPLEILIPGRGLGRDPERTPMQWDGSPNAGFCPPDADPWLPVGASSPTVNVAAQRDGPSSMLALTRRLIGLRRESPALHEGDYRSFDAPPGVFLYARSQGDERYLIALNFTAHPLACPPPESVSRATVRLSTYLDREGETLEGQIELRADEGLVGWIE